MAVSIDRNKVSCTGNASMQISEIALGLHSIASYMEERGLGDYGEIIDKIVTSSRLYRLTDSGMTVKEAMLVLHMNPDKIILSESIIPEELKEGM